MSEAPQQQSTSPQGLASSSSSSSSLLSSRHRKLVGEYLAQRVTNAGQIAGALGIGVEEVEKYIREVRREWKRGRRAKLDELGDTTLQSLDADEVSLRQMVGEAKKQKNLSVYLKLMDMIRDTQKLRLQIGGLLTVEGQAQFRAGVGESLTGGGSGDGEGKEGEDGSMGMDGDEVFRLYASEVEGVGSREKRGSEPKTEGSAG